MAGAGLPLALLDLAVLANVTLHLEADATIRGSEALEDTSRAKR